MADAIRHGARPVFYWGQPYGGTLEIALTSSAFKVFGTHDLVLKLTPVALTIAAAILTWRAARKVIGDDAAPFAGVLVLVFPPFFVYWLTKGGGYYALARVGGRGHRARVAVARAFVAHRCCGARVGCGRGVLEHSAGRLRDRAARRVACDPYPLAVAHVVAGADHVRRRCRAVVAVEHAPQLRFVARATGPRALHVPPPVPDLLHVLAASDVRVEVSVHTFVAIRRARGRAVRRDPDRVRGVHHRRVRPA